MTLPRIYADFNNADTQGRVRLNCAGTLHDLTEHQVTLDAELQFCCTRKTSKHLALLSILKTNNAGSPASTGSASNR